MRRSWTRLEVEMMSIHIIGRGRREMSACVEQHVVSVDGSTPLLQLTQAYEHMFPGYCTAQDSKSREDCCAAGTLTHIAQ